MGLVMFGTMGDLISEASDSKDWRSYVSNYDHLYSVLICLDALNELPSHFGTLLRFHLFKSTKLHQMSSPKITSSPQRLPTTRVPGQSRLHNLPVLEALRFATNEFDLVDAWSGGWIGWGHVDEMEIG